MIGIVPYPAEFRCGKRWQQCDVVGVMGERDIVRGPVEYVDTVAEVRRREPTPEPLG